MEAVLRRSFRLWPITICGGAGLLTIFAIWASTSQLTVLFGKPPVPQQMVIIDSIFISVFRILIGSLSSFLFATSLSIAIFSYNRQVALIIMSILFLIGVTPAPIWSTLAIMSFGLGATTPIATIVLSTVFLLTAVNINTLIRIPRHRLLIADLYCLTVKERIQSVLIPEAIPGFMLGFRLALLVSWIALITAESSGVEQGLGSLLLFGRQLFNWQIVIATWGAIIASAAITDGIVSALAEKAFRSIGE